MDTRASTIVKVSEKHTSETKDVNFTYWSSHFNTQYQFLYIYPLANGQLLAFDKHQVVHVLDLNDKSINSTLKITGLEMHRPLQLHLASLYIYGPSATYIFHPENFNSQQTLSVQFLQLEKLFSQRACTLLVGQTCDEPKKLKIFIADQIQTPIASVSIKKDTRWCIVNDVIVKLTADHRIKFLEFQTNNKFKKTGKLKYEAPEAKSSTITQIQPLPADDLLLFTVRTEFKINSYILDVKNKSVTCLKNIEFILKLPQQNYFLCVQLTTNKSDLVHIWNNKTKSYESSFESNNFNDVKQITYTAAGKPLLLKNKGVITKIEVSDIQPVKKSENEYKFADNPFRFQGVAHIMGSSLDIGQVRRREI